MSARKKGKKDPKGGRSTTGPAAPFRHRDGDRRRRGGPNVDEAIRLKRMIREAGALIPDPDPEEGDDDFPGDSPLFREE
jgi:hypothetical protein